MLPDWVFRIGWGLPITRNYLQLRMEAAQLNCSMPKAYLLRKELNRHIKVTSVAGSKPLSWAIKTSVPGGESGKGWGDLYFAEEIKAALENQGHLARVDTRSEVINAQSLKDDVVLVIRGVERIRPQKGAINIMWIISHPSRISNHELRSFDVVFAASKTWAKERSRTSGVNILPLLQATNPTKFNPQLGVPDTGEQILFIGNSRHQFRQIIKDCIEAGVEPAVYGRDWEEFISKNLVKSEFVANDQVGKMYRSAGVVLNDHWQDMAEHGFISNRLFDAAASGARVISDPIQDIDDIFMGAVKTYNSTVELKELCLNESRGTWGTEKQISRRAHVIGLLHSFDARVKILAEKAVELIAT